MIKNIKVWQLKATKENHGLMFSSLRLLKKFNLKFSMNNYKIVYRELINTPDDEDDMVTLENLYMRFQCSKPVTYTGHSLSVSDVIEIDGVNYYCDSIGFKKM